MNPSPICEQAPSLCRLSVSTRLCQSDGLADFRAQLEPVPESLDATGWSYRLRPKVGGAQ
jgi:hypothetical protein